MRTVVVGAGLSGLLAARSLAAAGHDAVVLDKGRSPGGRLATRRIEGATLDHGAQFFTVRSAEFGAVVDDLVRAGVVVEWSRGFGTAPDGHPRYRATAGMTGIAKHLAAGLDVRCDTLAFAVRAGPGRWDVGLDDASMVPADALVITTPVPQALSLLVTAGIELPEPLRTLDYDRTLALLAVLDGDPDVPPPGGAPLDGGVFAWVADNRAKGISARPALTMHASAAFSLAHWDDDRDAVHAELLAAAHPWLGSATVVASQVKRWRFATPQATWPEPCWVPGGGPAPLVLAGDAFGGPMVEGAARSGLAAARALTG